MTGPLDGIRVLELSRYQAGPRAGMILSDLGADVIKVERLGGEETRHSMVVNGQSLYFNVYNRGKRSLCLDLRKDAGKAVFRDLVAKADVVIENFRPGLMAKIGFDYDALCQLKADIILVSVSAFGQYGPYRERRGFDSVGQAMSGLMTLTGAPFDQPVLTKSSIVDRYTALHASIAILAALRHRDATGEGQVVDVCLLDAALTMVEIPLILYLNTGDARGESGHNPMKQAKDGYVTVSAPSGKMKAAVLRFLEQQGVRGIDDVSADGPGLDELLSQWCMDHSVTEVCDAMLKLGVVVAPVMAIPEVARDPHLWEREILVEVEDADGQKVIVPGSPLKFSKQQTTYRAAPTPGLDTDQILGDLLGYEVGRIAELRSNQVVE